MLRNALLTLMILVMGKSYAQENYFVLIQADNSQPFYVKLGDRSFSSTIKGRLILSQLKSGSYKITIGFPKQQFPEQQYTFNIEKDLEFQLKEQGEKGWGLFNPHTMEFRSADKKEAPPAGAHREGIKKDDAFSRLMAGVVGDTAVMYNTYALEEILNDTTSAAVVKADSPAKAPAAVPPKTPVVDSATATLVPPVAPPGAVSPPATTHPGGTIVKLSERKTAKGLRIAFADRTMGRKADTVIIIIPLDSPTRAMAVNKPDSVPVPPASAEPLFRNKADTTRAPAEVVQSKPDTTAATVSTDSIVRTDPNTIHVYIGAKKTPRNNPDSVAAHPHKHDTTTTSSTDSTVRTNPNTIHVAAAHPGGNGGLKSDSVHTGTIKTAHNRPDSTPNPSAPGRELYRPRPDSAGKVAATKPMVVNSDCRNFATDYDVDKLRVKMLEGTKDEDKILAARKIFKTKCFTTRQIKALSEVFATDAGKYQFFETAYPFVSDDHFKELTDLLTDPVYNAKFKAMTGQR